jgi:TRAP transporter TAXI family solute receptor
MGTRTRQVVQERDVMRIALTLGLCLVTLAAAAAPRAKTASKPVSKAEPQVQVQVPSPRETYRAHLNDSTITIMAGSPNGTDLSIAYDIAEVLGDSDNLRVLPMVGKGAVQNIKDVMYLRGVDMGITHANLLRYYARTGELGPNFVDQIVYVSKLFNEEVHILARTDVADITALNGQAVSLGEEGSGPDITGHLILEALGLHVDEKHFGDADAIAKLKSGEIAAAIFIGGKPAPRVADLNEVTGLKLLPIPYIKALEADYYPATLTHDDYPQLISTNDTVDTVAVCAVLIAFNWDEDSDRYKRVARFVNAFLGKFDAFLQPPRHPKWREVNFAATLEGWHRSPAAQSFIDRAKLQAEVTPNKQVAEVTSKRSFDAFLGQTAQASGTPVSDAERADLFRAFLAWSKGQPKTGEQ